ncbi:MAG TPA: hypothetical protein VI078_17325 [bacterium]
MTAPGQVRGAGAGAAAAVCALCVVLATALSFRAGAFLVDDAFISFRYAHHLAQGRGLTFNDGDRLEGYTNFLWVLILAGAEVLGFSIPKAAVVLGFLLGLACLAATWLLARAIMGEDDPLGSLLAVLPLAADRSFWLWGASGMENPLYAVLVVLGAACLLSPRPHDGKRLLLLGASVLALAALARPEAPLVFVVVLAVQAMPPRPALRARDLAVASAAFAAPLALYAAWKLWYFGELLPNTFYAKNVGAPHLVSEGRHYVSSFLADYGYGLGLAALLAAPVVAPPGRRRAAAVPAALTLCYLAYVWAVGGDIYYNYRFLTPVLPFLSVGLAATTLGLMTRLRLPSRPARHLLAAAVFLGFSVLAGLMSERRFREEHRLGEDYNGHRERVAAWLARWFPPETVIATINVGIIPYRTDMRTVDLVGLTHREIGRSRVDPSRHAPLAHEKSSAEAVLRERPDFIEFSRVEYPVAQPDSSPQWRPLEFATVYRYLSQTRYPAYRDLALREEFHRSYRPVAYPLGGDTGVVTFRRFPDGEIPLSEAWRNYAVALQAEGFEREARDYLERAGRTTPGHGEMQRPTTPPESAQPGKGSAPR